MICGAGRRGCYALGGGGSGATVSAIGNAWYVTCAGDTMTVGAWGVATIDGSATAPHPATAGQQLGLAGLSHGTWLCRESGVLVLPSSP